MPTALVLVQDAVPGRGEREVGSVAPALAALGFDPVVTTLVDGRAQPNPADPALVVVLGSEASASDDPAVRNRPAWLAAELAWLSRAVEAGTPVLGICFGAQALARVLGGENVTSLLVECGGEVNASFLLGGLAQCIAFFYAPKVLGGRNARKGVAGDGVQRVADMIKLRDVDWQWLGPDLLLNTV